MYLPQRISEFSYIAQNQKKKMTVFPREIAIAS